MAVGEVAMGNHLEKASNISDRWIWFSVTA